MTRALLVMATVALAGCSASGEEGTAAPAPTPTPAMVATEERDDARPAARETTRRGRRLSVVDSQFGRILADGRGQALYYFDKERTRRSECYGDCARAWPPVLTRGRPVAGQGVRERLLGTTRRRGGRRQVTYDGRPLYFYVDDAPGRVLCHNVLEFGGLWLVIRPDGAPVG